MSSVSAFEENVGYQDQDIKALLVQKQKIIGEDLLSETEDRLTAIGNKLTPKSHIVKVMCDTFSYNFFYFKV